MSWTPLIDQRTLSPNGATDCGEACVAMVLQHLGHKVSAQQVLALRSGNSTVEELLWLLQHFGLQGCSIDTGGFDNNDKLAITLIHDNNNADPSVSGRFEHFIVVYAQDAAKVYCANPWGGRDIAYPLSQFNPAYMECIIIPVAANTVVAPGIGGKHDMPIVIRNSTDGGEYYADGPVCAHITQGSDASALQAAGVPVVNVSDALAKAIQTQAAAAQASGGVTAHGTITGNMTVS